MTTDPYSPDATADTFDFLGYLEEVPFLDQLDELGGEREAAGRREATRDDPMLFAVLYLSHHLRTEETGGRITWSDAHLEWLRDAKRWTRRPQKVAEERDAYVAPRGTGKSTFFFLFLPLWAAAHGHVRFAAAFADSAAQAQAHLATLKRELETNVRLRHDYPDLCAPAKRLRGVTVSDHVGMLHTKSGFVFAARGIDSGSLGMKVGSLRPDLLLLDDVEPDESNYSEYQKEKRLTTVRDTVLPLNVFARVVVVGTVTMPGSIVHNLVEHGRGERTHAWVDEEGFRVHHALPILTNDRGEERSAWPAKWPMSFLNAIRRTRSFAKNYLNAPIPADGAYWTTEDLVIEAAEEYGPTVLSIDPATTSKSTSDYTGLSVVSRTQVPVVPIGELHHKAYVRYAEKVRLPPAELRKKVLELLERFPEIGLVIVETNQGGDAWLEVLHDLPVRIRTVHQKASKEVRAQRALNYYQRGQVRHTVHLPALDEELLVFPRGMNDDLVDSTGTAVTFLLKPRDAKAKARGRSLFAA